MRKIKELVMNTTLPIFKLEEYFNKYEFKAKYLLCSSDMQSQTLQELLDHADEESLDLWNNLSLGYTESPGLPLLREEIAREYPSLDAKNILCFAGAEEGIYCAMHTLLQAGDHAIVIEPCYQSLKDIAKTLDAVKVSSVMLKEQKNWDLDLDELFAQVSDKTKLIIINYPHNPTGAVLAKEKFLKLIEFARKRNIYIFSDEVYRDLCIDADSQLPQMAISYDKGLSLGVMSKSYGFAGLRVGWIAFQDKKLLHKMNQIKYYLSICNSAPSEILALIALRARDKILKKNNELLIKNFNLAKEFINKHSDIFSWILPKGGCVGFPRYHCAGTVRDFAHKLITESGILILPAEHYGIDSQNFRFGFGKSNFEEAIDQLCKII